MASELFQLLTDIDLIDVPYRGGAPALSDLLAGQVQVMFGVIFRPLSNTFEQASFEP